MTIRFNPWNLIALIVVAAVLFIGFNMAVDFFQGFDEAVKSHTVVPVETPQPQVGP